MPSKKQVPESFGTKKNKNKNKQYIICTGHTLVESFAWPMRDRKLLFPDGYREAAGWEA